MEIFVMHDGQQFGPLSPETVREQIDSGNFSMADYAWTVGLDDWKHLGDVLPRQAQPIEEPSAPPTVSVNKDDVKTCPFCHEQIRAAAVKCRFCGEWLESSSQPEPALSQEQPRPVSPPPVPPTSHLSPQESIERTNSMKAVGRALDEMDRQQRPANPQDKTTPKASATTGTQKKSVWRLIIGALLLGVVANSMRNLPAKNELSYVIPYFGFKLLLAAIAVWLVQ